MGAARAFLLRSRLARAVATSSIPRTYQRISCVKAGRCQKKCPNNSIDAQNRPICAISADRLKGKIYRHKVGSRIGMCYNASSLAKYWNTQLPYTGPERDVSVWSDPYTRRDVTLGDLQEFFKDTNFTKHMHPIKTSQMIRLVQRPLRRDTRPAHQRGASPQWRGYFHQRLVEAAGQTMAVGVPYSVWQDVFANLPIHFEGPDRYQKPGRDPCAEGYAPKTIGLNRLCVKKTARQAMVIEHPQEGAVYTHDIAHRIKINPQGKRSVAAYYTLGEDILPFDLKKNWLSVYNQRDSGYFGVPTATIADPVPRLYTMYEQQAQDEEMRDRWESAFY